MEETTQRKKSGFWGELREWGVALAIALVLAIFITQVIIVNARVPTESMEPTILAGDRVIGFRLSYLFSEPQRGDIVIFRYPDDEKQYYVKRVVGLPGERVEVRNGHVYINGANEPLEGLAGGTETFGSFGPYDVPEDHYFVMGDNRNSSWDSRFWKNTYVPKENIVGKGVFRLFPDPGLLE